MTVVVPPGAEPLGSKLYFFRSASSSNDVLISAHGGYYKGTKSFTVPGKRQDVQIIFYARHGAALQDPGMELIKYRYQQKEIYFSEGLCMNYALSKFQGRHAGQPGQPAETYQSIADHIDDEEKRATDWFNKAVASKAKGESIKPATGQIGMIREMNVVTVRNRWRLGEFGLRDIYLSEVVKLVRHAYPSANAVPLLLLP